MVRQSANDDESTTEQSPVDVRTTDLSEFDDGEAIRVHYRDAPTTPAKTVEGTITTRYFDAITTRYFDAKVLITTDDDRRLIVDLRDTAEDGGLRDFDTDETVGRPMFAEPAAFDSKTGEELRDELLRDDDDVATDGGTDDVFEYGCPECGSDDLIEALAANPDDVFEYGCRECGALFDGPADDDTRVGTDDTLRYIKVVNGAHEKTGKEWSRRDTHERDGEVYQEEGGLIGFRTPDVDGVFFVTPDGKVDFNPHDSSTGAYEVGQEAEVIRGDE